ncbi:MAG: ankyrin repeat domain-containing protein [Chitinophagales bacterium]|nr:ankyrin repeat domain-containing protein [Chitinophagales bacterium]
MNDIFHVVRLNEIDRYFELINSFNVNAVNIVGQNLLQESIASKNTLIGLDLISHGIDINHQDNNGQTALHYAAMVETISWQKRV